MNQILNGKVAIVYGAGAIGVSVAKAFAAEGAVVYLADQNEAKAKEYENEAIHPATVDVLDKDAVAAFVKSVVDATGHLDISFCATSTHVPGGEQGAALSELSYENFSLPIIDYTKAQLYTTSAASPYMIKQKSGVMMAITAVPSQVPYPFTAGFGPAWAAVEAMFRVLAAEVGQHGVRALCLHSAGSPAAEKSIEKTLAINNPELAARAEGWNIRSSNRNLLGKMPTLEEVGYMAAFMASDKAGVTTGTTINLNGGMVNH